MFVCHRANIFPEPPQGSEAKGMYFVQEGKVRIVKTNEETNEIEECVTLEKGSYFGELALINKRPTLASVYAASVEVTVACKCGAPILMISAY